MDKVKKPARRPRLEERKPLAVTKALQHLATTGDEHGAAEIAGCHVATIRRLLCRDDYFREVKKVLAAKALELSAAAQEVALHGVGKLSPYQATIASKVSSQQALELTGGVTPPVQINVQMISEGLRVLRRIEAELALPEPTRPEEPSSSSAKQVS